MDLEQQTPHRLFVVLDRNERRQVLAAFQSFNMADAYVLAHNDVHPWTNWASKARVITASVTGANDIARLLVRGTMKAVTPGVVFRDRATAEARAARTGEHVHAIPFFPEPVSAMPVIPKPPPANAHWSPSYFCADLVVFATEVVGGQVTHVLLVQRDENSTAFPGVWAFPGGFVDPEDESSAAAACREAWEEAGIRVNPQAVRLVHLADHPDRDPRGRIATAVYSIIVDSLSPVRAGDDARAVRWTPLSEASGLAFDHDMLLDRATRAMDIRS